MSVAEPIHAGASWALSLSLYLILAGQLSPDEIVAAVLVATAATVLSIWLRRGAARRFRFRDVPWLAVGFRSLAAFAADVVRMAAHLARPGIASGTVMRQPFVHGDETPVDAARRALVSLCSSLAPNRYVVALPDRGQELLVHHLMPRAPSADRVWPL